MRAERKMAENRQRRSDHHRKEDGRRTVWCQKGTSWQIGRASSNSLGVKLASVLEGGSLVALRFVPHGVHQPDPNVGQGANGNRMAFALFPFALVVLQGPGFALRGLPGKLMQSIAQRFDTGRASVNAGIRPTLKDHRRGACQGLQAGRIGVALPVITNFCQQPRNQAFSGSRQAFKDRAVGVTQKSCSMSLS